MDPVSIWTFVSMHRRMDKIISQQRVYSVAQKWTGFHTNARSEGDSGKQL